jgi:hypothetical protein
MTNRSEIRCEIMSDHKWMSASRYSVSANSVVVK